MSLVDYLFIEAAWVASAARFTNTGGTPIHDIADAANGAALSDEYTLTISGVVGGTCTVTVRSKSPNNPYGGPVPWVVNGVALNDGVTKYKNIVPGVLLGFSVTAANGNVGKVFVGAYLDSFDAFGSEAGEPSDPLRHRVVNEGLGPVSEAEARLDTHAVLVWKDAVGNAIRSIKPFAPDAVEKEDGGTTQTLPYVLSISGVAGAGAGKTADLSVDGVLVPAGQLTDLNAVGGPVAVSGDNLAAVLGRRYRFEAPHALASLDFQIDPNCANGDSMKVMIFYARHIQITDEVGGAPNDDGWTTDPVPLTQAGQAVGVIQAAGETFYYSRVVVPAGASAQKNPEPGDVHVRGVETGSAGW
jgi:hypothetical protein